MSQRVPMNTPDRNKTSELIATANDFSNEIQNKSSILANVFKEFADQLEAERDFADQINGQLVKLCIGLDKIILEACEFYDLQHVVTQIKKSIERCELGWYK